MKDTKHYLCIYMKKLTYILGAFLLFAGSCSDDEECGEAGQGGDVTFVVKPKHHSVPIYSQGSYPDTVMIKYDTQEYPGASPSLYDLVVVGDSGEDHVHIPGMKCGDYYIFATGLDTSIMERVVGGRPFSTAQKSGEITIVVGVTE